MARNCFHDTLVLLISESLILITTIAVLPESKESTSKEVKYLNSLKNYQLVNPSQYYDYEHTVRKHDLSTVVSDVSGLHRAAAYFTIIFQNSTYNIDLAFNQYVVSDSLGVATYSKTGERLFRPLDEKEKEHCYYQGVVRGIPGSRVSLSTCKGLKGTIFLPNEILKIEPLTNGTHVLSHMKNRTMRPLDSDDSANDVLFRPRSYSEKERMQNMLLRQKRQTSGMHFLELIVVASKAVYDELSSITDVVKYLISVANEVDGWYHEYNVNVVLVHVEIWKNGNEIRTEKDKDQMLPLIQEYYEFQSKKYPNLPWNNSDSIHIIQNEMLEVAGIAEPFGLCVKRGIGMIEYRPSAMETATVLTREIGRSFGLMYCDNDDDNDDAKAFRCACGDGRCIMDQNINDFGRPATWSQNSREFLRQNLKAGAYPCLDNEPDQARIILGPGCGNGVVDEGEECDCGFKEQCKTKCCNPETCQFTPNAVCDVGDCCENCQFLKKGAECRPSGGECDFPEFCTGSSFTCPVNVFKEDGSRCSEPADEFCQNGFCLSRDDICKGSFGSESTSPDICFEINREGSNNGNCGKGPDGNFVKCDGENIFCGKLACSGGKLLDPTEPFIYQYQANGMQCKTLSSIEMVFDGTRCGPGKTCQGHRCRDLPPSKCTPNCFASGACDNFGRCHCANGDICQHLQCNEGLVLNDGISAEDLDYVPNAFNTARCQKVGLLSSTNGFGGIVSIVLAVGIALLAGFILYRLYNRKKNRSFPGIKRFSGVIEADVCESKGNEPENVIQGTDYTVYPKLLQE